MDKSIFRQACIGELKKLKRVRTYSMDKRVIKKLLALLQSRKPKTVMLYIPLGIEINILSLIKKLRKEGATLLVPFMEGESFSLVKYRLPLSVKKFGVKEPNRSNTFYKQIDIAIVPVIGIDETFRRVGFGKGYYDRFFENHKHKVDTVVFIGRRSCIASTIVTDDYDVEGDLYITPKKIYHNKRFKR